MVQLVRKSSKNEKERKTSEDERLDALLAKYRALFQDELLPGLPSFREARQTTETGLAAELPSRPLHQVFPAELLAVEKNWKASYEAKARRSRSLYEASLFLVKEPDEMRAVVEYRASKRASSRSRTPPTRWDRKFDRLE